MAVLTEAHERQIDWRFVEESRITTYLRTDISGVPFEIMRSRWMNSILEPRPDPVPEARGVILTYAHVLVHVKQFNFFPIDVLLNEGVR